MKLIAFVGMPGSGKSEASTVARSMKIPVVSMGDVVREEAAKCGLPPTDENIGGIGTALRRNEGMDAISKRCVPKIRAYGGDVVVIDGTRNIEEVNYFKKQFGIDFMLIAINAPFDLRFERVKKRARSDDITGIEELKRRDEREKGWGFDKAMELADITINNTSSLKEFQEEIRKLLSIQIHNESSMDTIIEFGTKRVKPNVRMLFDMKDVIYDRKWLSSASNFQLYYMYRDLSLSKNDAQVVKEHGIRYDITVIPPRMLGCEFVKTAGHYHPCVHGTDVTFPEVYEVLRGEANYVMQKPDNDSIKDVIMVKAKQGDKVIIPPGYGHLTINASNKVLKMANWVARDFESIYSPIKEKGGGAYFILEDNIVRNQAYENVPELRVSAPTNIKETGFVKNKEMYRLVRDIGKLKFLTEPQEYRWLFEEMYG
jgi:glucose-6-phosphate isomerase